MSRRLWAQNMGWERNGRFGDASMESTFKSSGLFSRRGSSFTPEFRQTCPLRHK